MKIHRKPLIGGGCAEPPLRAAANEEMRASPGDGFPQHAEPRPAHRGGSATRAGGAGKVLPLICGRAALRKRRCMSIGSRALTPLDRAMSDESALHHIFSNLLSNTMKYSKPGTLVDFSAGRRGEDVKFVIRDLGIPTEDQTQVFTKIIVTLPAFCADASQRSTSATS
jgi:hypothetical protein